MPYFKIGEWSSPFLVDFNGGERGQKWASNIFSRVLIVSSAEIGSKNSISRSHPKNKTREIINHRRIKSKGGPGNVVMLYSQRGTAIRYAINNKKNSILAATPPPKREREREREESPSYIQCICVVVLIFSKDISVTSRDDSG